MSRSIDIQFCPDHARGRFAPQGGQRVLGYGGPACNPLHGRGFPYVEWPESPRRVAGQVFIGGTTHREETPMKTVVKCSLPGCDDYAVMKVAAPWKDGSHAELNTYGYACPAHAEDVVAYAEGRAKAYRLAPASPWGRSARF